MVYVSQHKLKFRTKSWWGHLYARVLDDGEGGEWIAIRDGRYDIETVLSFRQARRLAKWLLKVAGEGS